MMETTVVMTVRHEDDFAVGDLARKLYELPDIEVPVAVKAVGVKPAVHIVEANAPGE